MTPCLSIDHEHLQAIRDAARAAYPGECCGLLIGQVDGNRHIVTRVVPAENVWPGDRRRRYEMDPTAVFDAFRRARGDNQHVLGFYHSHPDGSASPSRYDLETAWPDKSYVIVAIPAGGVEAVRSWRADSDGRRLIEQQMD